MLQFWSAVEFDTGVISIETLFLTPTKLTGASLDTLMTMQINNKATTVIEIEPSVTRA